MMKTCCCTGHRPKGFPFKYGIDNDKHTAYLQALEQKIELAITEYGTTSFISGMAIGADMVTSKWFGFALYIGIM